MNVHNLRKNVPEGSKGRKKTILGAPLLELLSANTSWERLAHCWKEWEQKES
jgi:hypothetical protein